MNTKIFSGEPLPTAPPEANPDRASFDRKLLDYLRRLTAKLGEAIVDGGGNVFDVESFVSILAADGGDFVSNGISYSVKWTQDIHFNTAFFTHDDLGLKPEEITIVKDGVYQVEFDVLHVLKDSLDFWIEIGISGVFYKVSYSSLKFVSTDIVNNGWTGNLSIGIPMRAGTILRVRGVSRGNQGDPGNLLRSGTRISVIRIADTITGGTGGGHGWDMTPPSWTEVAP